MKIIVVDEDMYGGCNDCGYGGMNVNVYDTISQVLSRLNEVQNFELKNSGWRNVKALVEKTEAIALKKKFYVTLHERLLPVDIENLDNSVINYLCAGGVLLQEVDLNSVLLPDQLRLVNTSKKRIEKQEAAQLKLKEDRKQKVIEKKLEKARQLLASQGNVKE